MSKFLPFLLLFLLVGIGTVWANEEDEPNTEQKKNIIAVIDAQLEAFRSGNAEQAYSYASPNIQRQFPDSMMFMQMVKNGYNVLRQPTQVEYQNLYEHFGVWVQMVRLTDLNGFAFQAMYQMEQQESGEWKIGGCMLQAVSGEQI